MAGSKWRIANGEQQMPYLHGEVAAPGLVYFERSRRIEALHEYKAIIWHNYCQQDD